jgi:hypothetical protein
MPSHVGVEFERDAAGQCHQTYGALIIARALRTTPLATQRQPDNLNFNQLSYSAVEKLGAQRTGIWGTEGDQQ